jgi:hypothetical protein
MKKKLFLASTLAWTLAFNGNAFAYHLVTTTTGGINSCGTTNPGEVMYLKNLSTNVVDVTYEIRAIIGDYSSVNTVRLQPLQTYSTSTCSVTQYGMMQTLIKSEKTVS